MDCSQFIPALFRGIIHLMNDTDDLVVDMSWNALNAVTKVNKYNHGSVLFTSP